MALIIDVILVLILLCCAYSGWKSGFIKTLSGFLSYVLSFALANAFDDLFVPFVRKIPFLSNMITEGAVFPEVPGDATFLDKMQVFLRFLTEDVIADGNADAAQAVLKNCLAEILISCFAFIAVFLISWILLKLLLFALDFLIKKIPVIKQANGVLGALAGLLNGFIWTWAISNIFVKFLLPVLNHFEPNFFIMEIADSYIIHLCTKINPITYLFQLINLLS
ncbi:MAG: CvpA family protein [Ruminococcaceae bacterium]|nr:CvpA family protein [Oscillospiraceae bacterium]